VFRNISFVRETILVYPKSSNVVCLLIEIIDSVLIKHIYLSFLVILNIVTPATEYCYKYFIDLEK